MDVETLNGSNLEIYVRRSEETLVMGKAQSPHRELVGQWYQEVQDQVFQHKDEICQMDKSLILLNKSVSVIL